MLESPVANRRLGVAEVVLDVAQQHRAVDPFGLGIAARLGGRHLEHCPGDLSGLRVAVAPAPVFDLLHGFPFGWSWMGESRRRRMAASSPPSVFAGGVTT